VRRRPARARGRRKGRGDWRLTGGAHLSAPLKRKRRRGEGKWAGWAVWAEKGKVRGFSFSFSNLIFKTILNSNPFQTFANFSQIFYRLLETTQATKNHASQMMMHIHLLFLSLLYYL
jgi:hypothetical protein